MIKTVLDMSQTKIIVGYVFMDIFWIVTKSANKAQMEFLTVANIRMLEHAWNAKETSTYLITNVW